MPIELRAQDEPSDVTNGQVANRLRSPPPAARSTYRLRTSVFTTDASEASSFRYFGGRNR
jgi:hypothetical protein